MLLLRKAKSSLDDDDTMSTMSSSDSSFASRAYSVSFAEPLVTATHSRPRTTPEEKTRLFYTDADYREFRHAYMYGRRPRRRVLFAAALVSDVRVYAEEGAKASLYYSDEDLQRYVQLLHALLPCFSGAHESSITHNAFPCFRFSGSWTSLWSL
jgi:hypothetical protein